MSRSWEIVRKIPFENPWVTYIKAKILEKNNCINGIAVGTPGSGKSWGVLSLCAQIEPNFKLEGNWFFKASHFMRAITDYYRQDEYKPGKIWVLDEAGVDLNNLNYYDEINKGLNLFFQTARHRNYIFIATVPFISFISSGVRKLMNLTLRAEGWNKDNQTIMLPRVLQYNDEYDKFYKKRLLVETGEGTVPCNKILVRKPPKRLVDEYEKLKVKFTGDLFETTALKIEQYEQKQFNKFFGSSPTQLQEEILSYLKKKITVKRIAQKLDKNSNDIYNVMSTLRRKGFQIQPIRDGRKVLHYEVTDIRDKFVKTVENLKKDKK